MISDEAQAEEQSSTGRVTDPEWAVIKIKCGTCDGRRSDHEHRCETCRGLGVVVPDIGGIGPTSVSALVTRLLRVLTGDQRLSVLDDLGEVFCKNCGCDQPTYGYCQCDNDE